MSLGPTFGLAACRQHHCATLSVPQQGKQPNCSNIEPSLFSNDIFLQTGLLHTLQLLVNGIDVGVGQLKH